MKSLRQLAAEAERVLAAARRQLARAEKMTKELRELAVDPLPGAHAHPGARDAAALRAHGTGNRPDRGNVLPVGRSPGYPGGNGSNTR